MIRYIFSLALLLIGAMGFCQKGSSDGYFSQQRLRYEFLFYGNSSEEHAIAGRKIVEPQWGGGFDVLADPFDYGTHRYQVFDSTGTKLLFSKGFCPLFGEWQTTNESKNRIASFEQAVFFPMPRHQVVVKIEMRDGSNLWNQLLIDTIRPDDHTIIREAPIKYECIPLVQSGPSVEKIDILILSEGYTCTERQLFIDDARRMSDSLFSCEPFKTNKNRFNVGALMVPSAESGTDVPQEGVFRNTALNSTFNTFGSARYLTTFSMRNVYDAAAAEPWDHIIILVNSDRYGGGGCYNFECACSARNERSPFVFIHEFGHAFAGLGDEYYDSSTSYESFYSRNCEPWEPNLTSLLNFESKWKNRVEKGTPIPTPRTEEFKNTIGVFEGGGYETKGIFSPAQTCWMKEQKAGAFCPVCQNAITRMILSQSK